MDTENQEIKMKSLEISEKEQLNHLGEEIAAIIDNQRKISDYELIRAKWRIGEAIISSPLYKKFSKGNSKLFQELALRTQQKEQTLRFCSKFFEQHSGRISEEKKIVGELYKKFGNWTAIKGQLYEAGDSPSGETTRCRHCPIKGHCVKI